MKTNSQKTNSICVVGAIGFALLLLCAAPQRAVAQWTTSGNNISNTNTGNVGVGTTSPTTKLQVNTGTDQNLTVQSHVALSTGVTIGSMNDAGSAGQPIELRGSAVQLTGSGNLGLYVNSSGNVGIGTTNPLAPLDVRNSDGYFYAGFGYGSNKETYLRAGSATTGVMHIGDLNTTKTLLQENGGTVGIGTSSPNSSYKLDVNGNTNVTGDISLTGHINARYQDLAEWVPSSEQLPTGTVVVLDSTKSNQVISSSVSYDTRFAGVISEQPGIALGQRGSNKVLVATTGRVRVKVDATHGPIQVGDLLVTSDIPGVAMKSEPVNVGGVQLHRPGTLIGKALEPLAKGQSEILVLLSLQ